MKARTDAAIVAAAKDAAEQIQSDLEGHSAALDSLADMLSNMGEMADMAKNGDAQNYFALSNSVRAIHDGVGGVVDLLGKLNHGILSPPLVPLLPTRRGKAVRS